MKNLLKKEFVFFLFIWIIFCSLCPLFSEAEKKGLKLIRSGEALLKQTAYEKALEKFEEARDYIYTETNRLRLFKNFSRVYYVQGNVEESKKYIMKVLEIEPNARLSREAAPGFRVRFLDIRNRLKKLISEVRSLIKRELFAEARKMLEQAEEFKDLKQVRDLKNDIKQAERK